MGNESKETKKIRIIRISGDITKLECDAIITAINAGGIWAGGIDRAIYGAAGIWFHKQIRNEELYELNAIVVKGNGTTKFENVIFVVDELEYPLRSVISSGLEAAHRAGFKYVAIPSIRTGVMRGKVEREYEDVVNEYIEGVKLYLNSVEKPNIRAIAFVTYNNPELEEVLHKAIKNEGW
jgi:O-acetyl-ADP-ribose deacetylase (regulator of RNase III)